jgi:hypothetical protein
VSGGPKSPHGATGDGAAPSSRRGREGETPAPHKIRVGSVVDAHEAIAEAARAGRARRDGAAELVGIGASHAGEFRADFPRGSDFVDGGDGFTQRAAEAYRRIRNSPEDTVTVAANTGIDPGVVEGMRQNLFVQQHDIPLGPDHVERGYFTPDDDIADLWDGAARGILSPGKVAEFRNLAAHEYVENGLMEAGLPYRSSHPDSFDEDGDHIVHRDHPGAHDLAPNEGRPEAPLRHWGLFGLDSSGIQIAADLSNLDEVVGAALRGLRR